MFSGINWHDVDVEKVKRFIEKVHPVHEVSLVYDYQRRFGELMDLEEIKHKIEYEKVKIKQGEGGDEEDLAKLKKKFI